MRFLRIYHVKIKKKHQICFKKGKNMYLKAKNSLNTTRISSLKYVLLSISCAKINIKFSL